MGKLLQAPVLEDLVNWDEDGEELNEHGVQVEPGCCQYGDVLLCRLPHDKNTARQDFNIEHNVLVPRSFRTCKNYKKAR